MKKWIFATCALALALGASAANAKIATREWVYKQLKAGGVKVSTATVATNIVVESGGTVRTNYTVSSAFACSALPGCESITFVVSTGAITNRTVALARPSFLDLFISRAFADILPAETITATVRSGYWTDEDGDNHSFNLGDGLRLESSEELPAVPDATHTCEIGTDCNCKGASLTASTVEIPPEYQEISEETTPAWYDIYNWIDTENWQPQQTVGDKTFYFIEDADGRLVNLDNIAASDAWKKAIDQSLEEAQKRLKACRLAYTLSKMCDKSNPQHDWHTQWCGGNSWRVCSRNAAHGDTPRHTGHTLQERCLCGATASPHAITEGEKVAKTGNTGWTQTIACSLGCGLSQTIDHTCVHKYCRPCSAGDGCDWPCPTCEGSHNFVGGADACSRCVCPDCGIVKTLSIGGGAPVQTHSDHGGWKRCGKHEEEGNEYPGSYAHCVCECGFNSCQYMTSEWDAQYGIWKAGRSVVSLHTREDLEEPTYSRIEGDEGKTHHYCHTKSDCQYCGAPWAVKEEHQYPEEVAGYQYLSNEKCAERRVCEKCGHENVDEAEDAGSHSPDGEPFQFTDIGDDEHCRWWYHCSQCGMDYYEDDHAHQLPQTPTKWENVSASVCRAVKPCEKCGHEVKEDGEHVKSTVEADGCKCSKCLQYQFAHTLAEDACGNSSCTICGWVDPEQEETHDGHTVNAKCLCGRTDSPHIWGDWQYVGADGEYDVYRRVCTLSCGVSPLEKRILRNQGETCSSSTHILSPTNDCTCLCGLYNPSSPSSDKNLHTFTGDSCMCNCGSYHDKKAWPDPTASDACPAVCSDCKTRSASGLNVPSALVEDEHTPVSTGRCGCKCGKLNHSASAARFHPKHPLTCRCYGSSGNGTGSWHYPCGMTYCPNVCSYPIDGKYHVANTGTEPVKESSKMAGDEDHVRKDADCGCKCGVVKRSDIVNRPASPLHNIEANSYGCGCFCGAVKTPHRIPIGYCSCYCDYTHTNAWENACRVCSKCDYIIKHEEPKITQADAEANHDYPADACYCKCGAHLHADGHVFDADKCVCRCSDAETRPHILHQTGSSLEASDTCTYCHAQFYDYIKHFECQRCGATLPDVTVTIGMHRNWCRQKHTKTPTPTHKNGGCSACGCYCTGGSHTSCGGHYCSSCCTKPKKERKKDKPDYTPPNYPDPCGHPSSTVDNDSYSYTCDKCHRTIQVTDKTTRCATCGIVLDFEYEESEHGEHPPDEEETDDYGNTIDRCNCGCTECECTACQNRSGKCTTCHQSCDGGSSSTDSESGTETGGNDDLDDL